MDNPKHIYFHGGEGYCNGCDAPNAGICHIGNTSGFCKNCLAELCEEIVDNLYPEKEKGEEWIIVDYLGFKSKSCQRLIGKKAFNDWYMNQTDKEPIRVCKITEV